MINVHKDYAARYLEKGWVDVTTTWEMQSQPDRLELADPDVTCLWPMRSGQCRMDKDHNGRHSTVVFGCDGCDKTRRGSPHRRHPEAGNYCFMCSSYQMRGS